MTLRRWLAALAVAPLLIAGCSSDGKASPKTSAAPSSAGPAADAAGLAASLRKGTADLTSAHLDADAGVLGGTVAGDFAMSGGKTTASDVTIDQGSGAIEIITVGDTSYAKLPAAHNTSGKPWVKVSADSTNEYVRGLAATTTITAAATDLAGVTGLVEKAATSVQNKGSAKVGGVDTTRYALTIDPTKAPPGPLAETIGLLGNDSIPIQLWLDSKDRPVKVVITVKLGSQSLDLIVGLSAFDEPVTITAPPADQVSDS